MTAPAQYVSTIHTSLSFWRTLFERLRDAWASAFGSFGYKGEPPAAPPVEREPKVMEVTAELGTLRMTLSDARGRIEPPSGKRAATR